MKLLLFSGGVESTCLAVLHRPDILLTIDYGQVSAAGELRAAAHIAGKLGLRHEIIEAPLRELGTGDLAGCAADKNAKVTEAWPFRNQMLITLAAIRYEREGLREIMIGTVKSDSVHSDGSREFISSLECTLQIQNSHLSILAPAIDMTTLELVDASGVARDLLGWAFSCHTSPVACGLCRGCNKTVELFDALDGPAKEVNVSIN